MTATARPPLRLAFMGTPDFAVPSLRALIDAGHAVQAVYTQPPRRAGRGQGLRKSPVQQLAEQAGLAVRTPESLKEDCVVRAFQALDLDAAVVAAYGLLLPPPVLEAPRLGCLNLHASLLPRWRGAAPIQRAIMEGDCEAGVSIMRIEPTLDTGPVLLAERVAITASTTGGSLHDELAARGARLTLAALDGLAAGWLRAVPQGDDGIRYAAKLSADDERIDFARPSVELDRLVRALHPAPGAWFTHAGQRIKLLECRPVPLDRPGAAPGTVLDDVPTVACGSGGLALLRLQRPGRAAMDAAAFLRGRKLPPGTRLG